MKKSCVMLVVIMLIVAVFALTACTGVDKYANTDLTGELYDTDDTWAIYWYLCGSDLESENGFATMDIEEMLEVTLPDNVQVVIQAGGATQWQNEMIESDTSTHLLYSGDELEVLDVLLSRNMGSEETLEDFLRFCDTEYPADHQAVIMWNHGGGSLFGVAFDELYGMDSLSLTDIRSAFDAVFPLSEDKPPIEMIGLDACLMATVEAASAFRDVARYMVASEESEPGCGWNYSGFLQALADEPRLNGAMLGKVICDTYAEACEDYGVDGEITLSVIDLSRISPLLMAYQNMSVEALAAACNNLEFLTYLSRSADTAEKYGPNDKNQGYTNMVDFGDLAKLSSEYLPGTASTVENALNDCVFYKINGPYRTQASGLSCYYPYDMDMESFYNYTEISPSPAMVHLYEYLITGRLTKEGARYVETMEYQLVENDKPPAPQIPDLDSLPEVPSLSNADLEDYAIYVDNDGNAVLDIGAESADVLSGVYFELAYVSEEDDIILLLGRDNDIDTDWENGVFRDNFRGVWGAVDDNLVYMELTYEGDDYNLYSIPILLNGQEYCLRVCYQYDSESYEILGARRGLSDNGMSDKNLIKLEPGDVITTLHYVLTISGDDDEPQQVEIDTFTVTSDTYFAETDLGDGDFILLFEMVDARGDSMYSAPASITVEDDVIYIEAD